MKNGKGQQLSKLIRCAVYTRKSTDEGLQQDFNSLDAQREAAEAFILSQKHEGWRPVPHRFDDGGYTGGNMDRPALKRLLEAVADHQIDCVVVYKVDRLSRSLLDFARIMIQAEFRHEDLARSKDLSSAKTLHAVAKVVFAIQNNLSKKLRIPKGAASLEIVWDKLPSEAFLVPIRLLTSPLRYGLRLQVKVDPEKDVYIPGDTLRTTFLMLDGSGKPLKISEFAQNGITRLITHLDGPRQAPTFYHEEWLNDFRGKRYAHHFHSPALGMERDGRSEIIPLAAPPLDATGSQIVVDLHIPRNLPPEAYGTFVIGALFGRDYGSQKLDDSLERPIQVGRAEPTHFESFGCASCHVPGTGMEIGLLLPPMSGIERLRIDRFEECVLCHDNSRDGSRRLDKFLHLIHQNRDNFPASKNNCVVCHPTAASIRKVSIEACSQCHGADSRR